MFIHRFSPRYKCFNKLTYILNCRQRRLAACRRRPVETAVPVMTRNNRQRLDADETPELPRYHASEAHHCHAFPACCGHLENPLSKRVFQVIATSLFFFSGAGFFPGYLSPIFENNDSTRKGLECYVSLFQLVSWIRPHVVLLDSTQVFCQRTPSFHVSPYFFSGAGLTKAASTPPRIGMRHLTGINVVRRAPLPRLGLRMPGQRRTLPLPRIGKRANNDRSWKTLENAFSRSLPRAGKDWRKAPEKRPVPLPRMG